MAITVGGTNITLNSGSVLQDPPGTAPSYLCRAWVNFNGTGTVAIRASGNVSSITDNGVGDYTVNFTVAMTDVNYNFVGSGALTDANNSLAFVGRSTAYTASSLRIWTITGFAAAIDPVVANVTVFR